MSARHAQHNRKAHALAAELVGVEGIKHAGADRRCHAAPVIRHLEVGVAAGRQLLIEDQPLQRRVITQHHPGRDRHRPDPAHNRLGGVLHQPAQELLQLMAIGADQRHIVIQLIVQLDAAEHHALKELTTLINQCAQLNRGAVEATMSRVEPNLAGQFNRPVGRGLDLQRIVTRRCIRRHAVHHNARIAHHRREQVIEIVRHARGHDAEAFDLFGLDQALAQAAALTLHLGDMTAQLLHNHTHAGIDRFHVIGHRQVVLGHP